MVWRETFKHDEVYQGESNRDVVGSSINSDLLIRPIPALVLELTSSRIHRHLSGNLDETTEQPTSRRRYKYGGSFLLPQLVAFYVNLEPISTDTAPSLWTQIQPEIIKFILRHYSRSTVSIRVAKWIELVLPSIPAQRYSRVRCHPQELTPIIIDHKFVKDVSGVQYT
jgi:hypothetical protein